MRLLLNRAARVMGVALSAAVVALAGCQSHTSLADKNREAADKENLVATHWVTVETKPTDAVVLSLPTVRQHRDTLIVEGMVMRKADMDTVVPGLVHVVVWSKEGVLLENIPLLWKPDDIPVDGTRTSKYHMDYLWTMPKGATVRIVYHDKQDYMPGASETGAVAGYGGAPGSLIQTNTNVNIDTRSVAPQGPSSAFNAAGRQ